MTGLEAGLATVGVLSTAIAVYVGLKFDPLKEQQKQDRQDHVDALKNQAELYDRRIDALHADKKELERRMNDLEKVALTRSEIDALRRDMENSIEKMGDRVMDHFDKTAERLEKRIEKVEASGAR